MRVRSVLSIRSFALVLLLALAPPAAAYEQQVQQLSRELAAQLGVRGVVRVAVVDFTDLRGEVNELGRFLAEELSVALNQSAEGFQVIDRTRLAVVFAEHKLGASGLIAPEDAKRLGQLVGADVLVSATMTPFGESVRLSVKALETETAVLVASARGDVPRTGAVDELLGRGMGERRKGTGGTDQAVRQASRLEPVASKGFLVDLQSCHLSGQSAECLVVVQNQAADRLLGLTARSRLFDDLGNEYAPSLLRIANQSDRASYGTDREGVQKTLIQSIQTPAALIFEGISGQATRVALLTLWMYSEDFWFSVQFRDFPFSSDLP
jgi:TolB-like protein